jgi:hypothetical protein
MLATHGQRRATATKRPAIAALFGCYFMMVPWSRIALFGLVPLIVLSAWLLAEGNDANERAYAAGQNMFRSLFTLLFLLAAYRSTRNRLGQEHRLSLLLENEIFRGRAKLSVRHSAWRSKRCTGPAPRGCRRRGPKRAAAAAPAVPGRRPRARTNALPARSRSTLPTPSRSCSASSSRRCRGLVRSDRRLGPERALGRGMLGALSSHSQWRTVDVDTDAKLSRQVETTATRSTVRDDASCHDSASGRAERLPRAGLSCGSVASVRRFA